MAGHEPVAGFAMAVVREDGRWSCSALEVDILDGLTAVSGALQKIRSTGALFALVEVDEELFIIVRPGPAGPALLLSDTVAGLDYDIALDVLDELGAEQPDDQEDAVVPTGDLEILADFGLSGLELELIIGETDLYPDEQLQMIAERCGFAEQFSAVLDEL
jgi:putative tRNA adenosine deaminase-associated protein